MRAQADAMLRASEAFTTLLLYDMNPVSRASRRSITRASTWLVSESRSSAMSDASNALWTSGRDNVTYATAPPGPVRSRRRLSLTGAS